MARLAIKVDVDTYRGYLNGVPRLLDLFAKKNIKASIFFSFGPDNSGKAIRRIFRPGFISKMFRTKAPTTYGIKTLLYGTLLPAPMIVAAAPEIVKRAYDGHDVGIHAWDHVYVQDCLDKISKEEYLSLFNKASEIYQKICGQKSKSIAAPGWQVSHAVLSSEQQLGLSYASDVRGYCPFIPVFDGREYSVPQIPTTMATMDEIYGLPGINDETVPLYWLKEMTNEWNVLTVHAEMEGMSKLGVLERFIDLAYQHDTKFFTLKDYRNDAPLPRCKLEIGTLLGRAGTLAEQGAVLN
ncbi:MAG: polysaccharide deacetylase family protein [Synergistaceae bacterium]|nr:polysaccharide deacetylase family protein [Synergistaceae bacterium]